jgi:purine-binding chemotaxis protein CheW
VSDEKATQRAAGAGRRRGAVGLMPRTRAHLTDADQADSDEEQLKLAGFRVGGGLYGIDIMRIKEVIQAAPYPVREVPHAPGIVEGVIALRGIVIPVVDLRKRFGVTIDPELARLNKLIIVSVRGRIVGLKVDRILGELRVPSGAVRPAPSMLHPSGRDEFFAGVCRKDDEMVFVVNLETVIDPRTGSAASAADEQEER